jgi:hypothetical protein
MNVTSRASKVANQRLEVGDLEVGEGVIGGKRRLCRSTGTA